MADESPAGSPHLRTLDWRFLLPPVSVAHARRLVVLGGPAGVASLAIEHGLAGSVRRELPDDGHADVIVVLSGAPLRPLELARALAAGGSLYVEVDRRSSPATWPSLPVTVRRLERAGLTVTGTYLVATSPDGPRHYVPLCTPDALRWYVRNVHRPVLRMQRLTAALVAVLPRWCGAQAARRTPTYAITARLAASTADDGPAALAAARAAGMTDSTARPLVMAAGGDRVVVLPFAGGDSRPMMVLKIPRAPALRARSAHEQEVLRALRAELPASLAAALPQPLGIIDDGRSWTTAERYLPGRSLLASSGTRGASRARRLADLRLGAAWLESFHLATERRRVPWSGEPRSRWLGDCVDRYRASVGSSTAEERMFDAASSHSDRVAHLQCPIVCQHRDFAVWNLARDERGLAVLDWEGAREGPPLCDLLHLVTSWDLVIRRPHDASAELDRIRSLLVADRPGDALEAEVHEVIASYLARMAIDRDLVPLLLLHHWMELAVRRADQLRDHDMDGSAAACRENGAAAVVAMLAEHAEVVFGANSSSAEPARRH